MLFPLGLRRCLAVTTALSLVLPALPAAAQVEAVPPARVGEILGVSGGVSFNGAGSGGVSFNGAGSGGWAAAQPNYPVSAGDSLYTQPGAQAAIAVDASTMTLAENTELQVTGLTDDNLGATEAEGEVFLAINGLRPGTSYKIATPRGTVTIGQDGAYDIQAGDQTAPTVVSVFAGAAIVAGQGAVLQLAAGQAAYLAGGDQTTASLGQAQPDGFAQGLLAQSAAPPPPYAPPAVSEMTGAYQLTQYGDWQQDSDYGAVWYPNVGPDWAPYREGHWANIEPWGWTWVDSAPWGFAPFHYGRWIDNRGRWGWIPADRGAYGVEARPVYAPAIVSFFGLGLAAGLTAAALASHSIGWVPLGPGEAFRPYYRASPEYDRRINAFNVRDVNGIDFRKAPAFDPAHFADRRAATTIPAEAMGRGDNVARFGHAAGPEVLTRAGPAGGDLRLPPAAAPLARQHPAEAPRPSDFSQRHDLPAVRTFGAPQSGERRPGFGANPGYRAPPPPPGMGAPHEVPPNVVRPGTPGGQSGEAFRPPIAPRPPMPQVFQPDGQAPDDQRQPAFRPPAGTQDHLPQIYRPQAPEAPMYRPQAPEAPMYRPQAPEAPAYRPQAPEAPRPPVFQPQQAQPLRPQPMQQPMQQPHFNPAPRPQTSAPFHPQ